MSNSMNPVFGEWYTDKQLGAGTDGKVFSIYRQKYDGNREISMLKIIRLGENRNERKPLETPDDFESAPVSEEEYYNGIITQVTRNIRDVMKSDGGKHFVKYEDLELRKASDGKGRLILIKMEEMRSLADLLKEFSFTLEETLRLGISVCQALIKCRSFGGYIYPNLKPENVLFDREGICKLGDFGTFSLLEPNKASVAYKRTEYYMAPEYMKTGNMNCTVDTYSLGLILFMLTNRGRLPFTEEYPNKLTVNSLDDATARRVAGEELPKPSLASPELAHIIAKACAFNPNERYFTPNQMLKDLENALHNKPFEPVEYNDVYSVTPKTNETPEEVIIPEVDAFEREPEQETQVLSLREEIKIPEIISSYHKKKPQAKRRPVRYEKLPEIKNKKAPAKNFIKRITVLAVITVILFILFIASLVLNLNANKTEETMEPVMAEIHPISYMINGGALLNGC